MTILKKINQQVDMTIIIDDEGYLLLADEDDNICFRIHQDYVWMFVGKVIEALEQFDGLQKDKTKAH